MFTIEVRSTVFFTVVHSHNS